LAESTRAVKPKSIVLGSSQKTSRVFRTNAASRDMGHYEPHEGSQIMKHTKLARWVLGALLVTMPMAAPAEEPAETTLDNSAWQVAIRFGGFSDNGPDGWLIPRSKYYVYDRRPQVTGSLDISRLFGPSNGVTLSFEGMTFAGDSVVMAPVTLTYKYFPMGNGVGTAPGQSAPAVQPWVGIGGGVYSFILDDENITRTEVGAQASAGLFIPLSRSFDLLGELRYSAASDARVLSYTMGFGVRF
jgi:hypothetical protein